MNRSMIFTVTDTENCGKPVVRAELTSDRTLYDKDEAERLIRDWAGRNLVKEDLERLVDELEDLAYSMRKDGYAWFNEQYCFELTEIFG